MAATAPWLREHKLAAWSIVVTVLVGLLTVGGMIVAAEIDKPAITAVRPPISAPGQAQAASGPSLADAAQGSKGSKPVQYSYYPARAGYRCRSRDCEVAPSVTLDSVVDNPVVGDERPFLAASINSRPVQNRVAVTPGSVVTLRLYIDNNADQRVLGAAATALNVNLNVLLPDTEATWFNIVGFLSADNTLPAGINDCVLLTGTRPLKLLYVPGSARFTHLAAGKDVSDPMSDAIVTARGVGLGDIGAGTGNSGFVTLQVRLVGA